MYLPKPIYEGLPYIYFALSTYSLVDANHWAWYFSAFVFYTAGSIVWIERSSMRRKDIKKFWLNHKKLPEILYESMPFLYFGCAVILWQLKPTKEVMVICALIAIYSVRILITRAKYRSHEKPDLGFKHKS